MPLRTTAGTVALALVILPWFRGNVRLPRPTCQQVGAVGIGAVNGSPTVRGAR